MGTVNRYFTKIFAALFEDWEVGSKPEKDISSKQDIPMVPLDRNLGKSNLEHILNRCRTRGVKGEDVQRDLTKLLQWANNSPKVYEGKWYIKLPTFMLAGNGARAGTVLLPGQPVEGKEIFIQ